MDPGQIFVLSMTGIICGTVVLLGIARAIIGRVKTRDKMLPGGVASDPAVLERLNRMEQAIDAIAVEVERVSEGQRFVTKLLADSRGAPSSLPRP